MSAHGCVGNPCHICAGVGYRVDPLVAPGTGYVFPDDAEVEAAQEKALAHSARPRLAIEVDRKWRQETCADEQAIRFVHPNGDTVKIGYSRLVDLLPDYIADMLRWQLRGPQSCGICGAPPGEACAKDCDDPRVPDAAVKPWKPDAPYPSDEDLVADDV